MINANQARLLRDNMTVSQYNNDLSMINQLIKQASEQGKSSISVKKTNDLVYAKITKVLMENGFTVEQGSGVFQNNLTVSW